MTAGDTARPSLRCGDVLSLRVESLAFGGDSLAHADDGRVVFFAGGAPGDLVRVRIEELRVRFARGTLCEVVAPGPAHVAARCGLVGRCGGCQWQEVALPSQRAAKQAIVARALERLGVEVLPLVTPAPDFGYRGRARFTVAAGASPARPVIGLQARRSHDVVDVPGCPLLEPALDAALALARRHLGPHLPPGAAIAGLSGAGGDVHLAVELPADDRSGEGGREARARLRTACVALAAEPGIAGVIGCGAPIGASVIDLGATPAGNGEGASDAAIATAATAFHGAADGFAQAGHAGNRALRRVVAAEAQDLLAGRAGARVLELHAGDGNFTRDLVAQGARVLAVESDRAAAARPARNVPGAEVVPARAADAVRRLAAAGERFDLVLLDPPRTGAADVAPLLASLSARVLYVACDPMTLARDVATLGRTGLRARRATPIDLMPHTFHVEVVCALSS